MREGLISEGETFGERGAMIKQLPYSVAKWYSKQDGLGNKKLGLITTACCLNGWYNLESVDLTSNQRLILV